MYLCVGVLGVFVNVIDRLYFYIRLITVPLIGVAIICYYFNIVSFVYVKISD